MAVVVVGKGIHTQPHILHIRNKHYSCVSDVQAELERLGSTPLLDLTGVP